MNDEDKSLEQLEQELAPSQDPNAASDGTESTQAATDSDNSDAGEQIEDSAALKAQLEEAKSNLAKIEMERNLLRNKQKDAERKQLESVDKTKLDELTAAYDKLLQEKLQREQEEAEANAQKEAEAFRESLLAKRSPKLQAAAKALIAKNPGNLAWNNARDAADAEAQLNTQLDALEEVLGKDPVVEEDKPVIHPNNPAPRREGQKSYASLDEELAAMEKELPWAPPR